MSRLYPLLTMAAILAARGACGAEDLIDIRREIVPGPVVRLKQFRWRSSPQPYVDGCGKDEGVFGSMAQEQLHSRPEAEIGLLSITHFARLLMRDDVNALDRKRVRPDGRDRDAKAARDSCQVREREGHGQT